MTLLLGDPGGLDSRLVVGERLGRGVLQRRELGLERREVRGLGVQRRLSGGGRLLGDHHLSLGLLLETVALGARDDGLVAEALRGVARGDGVGIDGLVPLDELVHRAQTSKQVIRRRCRTREEQLERGVITAIAVELRSHAARLVRGFRRQGGLLVGLRLKLIGASRLCEEGLLGFVERIRGDLRRGLRPSDLLVEALDQSLDLRDLGGLGRLVGHRGLHVVPRGVVRGESGRQHRGRRRRRRPARRLRKRRAQERADG